MSDLHLCQACHSVKPTWRPRLHSDIMRKRFWLLMALSIEVLISVIIICSSRHYMNWIYAIILQKKHVTLVVGIISAPKLSERRHAIRNTWKQFCQQRDDVVCKFFVDSLHDMEPKVREGIVKENAIYNDIEYMEVPPGVNFGRRILWLLEWSVKNYVFDFVLRMDDDVFPCLERLVNELQYRKEKRYLFFAFIINRSLLYYFKNR